MIAFKENGQWGRVTLRQLRQRFPNVSFRRSIEAEGQTWEVDGQTYAALVIQEVAAPVAGFAETVSPGPLEETNNEPIQTWIVTQREITGDDVNDERAGRIRAGVDIDLPGVGVIGLQGRERDQIALSGLKDAALLRIQGGDSMTTTKFRDRLNVIHELDPPEVVALWSQGAAWLQAIYEASWALKPDDGTLIPADFADDAHWP